MEDIQLKETPGTLSLRMFPSEKTSEGSPSDRNCVMGWGRVCGRKVFVTADDFSVRGGHADGGIQGKAAYGEVSSCSTRLATDRHFGVSVFRIWLN